jgi:hypothetical protein
MPTNGLDEKLVIGRALDSLTLDQRVELANKWLAFEVYTPQTLPLRRIEAFGDSPADCIRKLKARGLNPLDFEMELCKLPY